jgi:glutamate racemase
MGRNKLYFSTMVLLAILFVVGCNTVADKENLAFPDRLLNDPSDYYYVDFTSEQVLPDLPIGMFDSGTGGLTVLHALIHFDSHDNASKEYVEGGDGIKDFLNERFIYFGDQANMPYGNYHAEGKTDFLKELILKDVLFLLGNKYYLSPEDKTFQTDKQTVKLIVIACNTATAYGKSDIEVMLAKAGSNIKVIGVIDAGVRGALADFQKDEDGTVAVFATAGTVSSNGYLNTFNTLKTEMGYTGKIEFVQQSGAGLAEAIDEEPDFIDRDAKMARDNYKGPTEYSQGMNINRELLHIYNFDTTGNAILCEMQDDFCHGMQLNSPENYIRFHLVAFCEQLKQKKVAKPLKTLILGCTHYPFYSSYISKTLREMYDLKVNGEYLYRDYLAENVTLIDPAVNTAKEVYEYLSENNLLNGQGNINESEFYISVPDRLNKSISTDSLYRFTYEYKYGRDINHFYDTKQVPVSRLNTSPEITMRLEGQIPEIFDMIRSFNWENEKTTMLKPEERF